MHRCRAATRVPCRTGRRSPAPPAGTDLEQLHGLDVGLVERQRQHDDVELAAGELVEQHPGLGLAQFDLQLGIVALQRRQHPRQHIGRQRRDDAQASSRPVSTLRRCRAKSTRSRAAGRICSLRAATSMPDIGQHDVARTPLDHLHAQLPLQVADLHGQRRLGDRAGVGGPAKMPMLGQRGQISQLFQRDHGDKINLSMRQAIRLDLIFDPSQFGAIPIPHNTSFHVHAPRRRKTWTQRLTTRARASARSRRHPRTQEPRLVAGRAGH